MLSNFYSLWQPLIRPCFDQDSEKIFHLASTFSFDNKIFCYKKKDSLTSKSEDQRIVYSGVYRNYFLNGTDISAIVIDYQPSRKIKKRFKKTKNPHLINSKKINKIEKK